MRKILKSYSFGIIALGLVLFSCSRPKEVHSKKEMERIMYDVYIAEALIDNDYSTFNTPEKKEALINEVFKKNRTTQERWDTSLSWYSDRVDTYLKINDSVRARLQRQHKYAETLMNREISMEQSIKDRSILSSDIPTYYSFYEVNPRNGFRFRIDSTQIKEMPDSIDTSLSFQIIGIPTNHIPSFTSKLVIEYKDTIIYKSSVLTENKKYSLPFDRYIYNDTLQSVVGYIKLQDTLNLFRSIQLMNINIGNLDSLSSHPDILSTNEPVKLENQPILMQESRNR